MLQVLRVLVRRVQVLRVLVLRVLVRSRLRAVAPATSRRRHRSVLNCGISPRA
jgi:hypothetical protein